MMMRPNRPRYVPADAARMPQEATKPASVVPGTGWVCERTDENGVRSVLPLIAWEIVDHEVYPLPRSMRADWLVRPMVESDAAAMSTTASRMRSQPTNRTNNWNQWRTNLWP